MRTMTGTRFFRRTTCLATAAAFSAAALTAFAPEARADEISPRGKGITGGALLGAEVITITEALLGVKEGWAYLLGAGVGAAGGGVAGYFIEEGSTDGRIPVYMLAGGISLVIPALVLSLNATRYQSGAEASEDNAPRGPTPEPGTVGGSVVIGGSAGTPAPTTTPAPVAPTPPPAPATPPGSGGPPSTEGRPQGRNGGGALLHVGGGMMRLGVPVPQVRAMYSLQQMKELGVQQQTEYRLPVVSVTF